MTDLEQDFEHALHDIYLESKRVCKTNPTRFLNMITDMGAVETARTLLNAREVQVGFTDAWLCGRLDLTVEYVVLRPEFETLFTPEQLQTACNRLRQNGMNIQC